MSCAIRQHDRAFLEAERCLLESRFKPGSPEMQDYINSFGKPYYMLYQESKSQVQRGRGTQRKPTDYGSRNYKVRPSPLIRKEEQPEPFFGGMTKWRL